MTPIQELIEKCGYSKTFDGKYMIVLSQQEVEELLEKEKKHIIKAVNKTEADCVKYCNRIHNLVAEPSAKDPNFYLVDKDAGINYYNETYNK